MNLIFRFVVFGLLLFTISNSNIYGQKSLYTSKNYSIAEGLSHYKVQSIFKDSDGYLWIGTEDGLNKFDGTNFITFINDPQDVNSLSSGNIYSIAQDTNGYIWIGIDGGGINIIDPKTYKITKLFSDSASNRLKYIKHIYIDSNNIAWVATWGGLIRYDIKNSSYEVYYQKKVRGALVSSDIKHIVEDHNRVLWLATDQGISSFDKKLKQFENHFLVNEEDSSVERIFCDAKNQIWLSTTNHKIFSFNQFTNQFSSYHIKDTKLQASQVTCFFEDQNNTMYFGTTEGVFLLTENQSDGQAEFLKSNLIDFPISYILEGTEGVLYIGTMNKGLFVLKKNHFNFLSLDSDYYTNNRIRTIIGGQGNSLWFGSRGRGVVQFNRETNEIKTFLEKTEIKDYIIESLLIDSENTLWVGTYNNGLFKYNFKTEKITKVLKEDLRIEMLFEDEDGTIWIATNRGTKFYDIKKKRLVDCIKKIEFPQEFYTSHQVHFIEYDNDHNIWFNINSKVYVVDPENYNVKRIVDIQDKYEYISFEHAPNGKYYLGTLNGGMVVIDKNQTVEIITEKKGLASNRITSILSDKNNAIWYSTTKGLGNFNVTGNNFFKKYNTSNGIQELDYYLGSRFKDTKGWMYYGGVGGITYFHPDSLKQRKNRTQTIISSISVYNKKIKSDTVIAFKKKLELNYRQDFLNFKFNSLDFSEKGKYKYHLIGLDDDWSLESKSNEVSYTNLQPGEYTFQVKSSNSEGVWNPIPAEIKINITPPFWQRWWFYMILIVLFFGIALLGIKVRERKLKTEAETAQFKLQALRSQMNPHFIFNALNSIQHFIIKNETKFALKYLTKFSKLVRKILENSFHLRIPLAEEVQFLSNYIEIESLRFDNNINYTINVDKRINVNDVEIPSMLIQPYVENSILHGLMHKNNGGTITIDFIPNKKSIKCVIEDDGVGREASKEINKAIGKTHNSFGLPITKSRLEELNKTRGSSVTITIEDVIEDHKIKGTKVELHIPVE